MRPDRSLGVAEFAARYQLQSTPVSEGPVRSYQAVAHGGAVVLVHFLEDADHAEDLLRRLDRLESREGIRAFLDVAGTPVLVTRFVLDFSSLDEWVDERVGPPDTEEEIPLVSGPHAPPESRPPAPEAVTEADDAPGGAEDDTAEGPGEFTRLFQAPDTTAGTPPDAPAASSPEAPAEPTPDAPTGPPPDPGPKGGGPPQEEPGEFTRLFQAPDATGTGSGTRPPPERPASPPPPRAPKPPPPSEPAERHPEQPAASRGDDRGEERRDEEEEEGGTGGFTELFQAPSMPRPDRPEPPHVPDPPPEKPRASPPPPPPPPPGGMSLPQPPSSRPARPPGRFTQQFQAPTGDGESGSGRASPPPEPGSFTRLFRGVDQPPPGSPPPGSSKGPGEGGSDYLARLRQNDPSPGSAPRPGPPAPPAPGAPPRPGTPSGPGPAGPSDFTRVVAGHSRPAAPGPPPPVASAPTAPEPSPGRDPSRRKMILGLAGVVGALIVVLLVFGIWAMATSSSSDPADGAEPVPEATEEATEGG